MDDVSVLIRTKNEARWLPVTVQAIRRQRVQPREIIIVDSGSTDGTLETVEGTAGIRIVRISPQAFTFGRALNLGFQEAQGGYVACLSAHAVPTDDAWLSALLRGMQHPRTAGVYGRQLPQPDACPPIKRDLLTCYGETERAQTTVADHFFSNANALIRRDTWRRFRFDERLPYSEDQLWAKIVISVGYQIVYAPQAAVYHSHSESLVAVYRRARVEALAWRQLNPGTSRGLRDSWREWYRHTVDDASFVLRSRGEMRWLLFSAGYRLAQTLGRYRAFRVGGVGCAMPSQPVGGAFRGEETHRDG